MRGILKLSILSIVVIGTAITAYARHIASEAPRAPEFDQSFVPRQAAAQPRRWSGKVESTCPMPASPPRDPAICIAAPDKPVYARGDAIGARISWRNVPANSSFVLYLVRDQPDEETASIRYLGPTGALVLRAIPVSGDGSMNFSWNGREFACAPADGPMLCQQTADVGRYRIAAMLYDRSAVTIVGWPDRDPPTVIALSTSPAFVVRGAPDLGEIARSLWWAAMDQAMAQHEIEASSILVGDMTGRGLKLYQRGARICAQIAANPPYRSTLEACAPKAVMLGDAGLMPIKKADIVVTGHVTVTAGALSRARAIVLAQAVANKPYRPRVAFDHQPSNEESGYDYQRDGDYQVWSRAHPAATTYLGDSISEAIYRPDLGGGWVIVVNEIMAGGSLPDSQRFADKVLVFVSPDGKACALETRKYRGDPFAQDPKTVKFSCP